MPKMIYYAFGPGVWGKGENPDIAKKNLRAEGYRKKRLLVYRVSENVTFYDDGSFSTPQGEPMPELIERRGDKGEWLEP